MASIQPRTSPVKFVASRILFRRAGHASTVRALLEARADPDRAQRGTGCTALFAAAQCCHDDVVSALVRRNGYFGSGFGEYA